MEGILFGTGMAIIDVVALGLLKSIHLKWISPYFFIIPVCIYAFQPFLFYQSLNFQSLAIMNILWDLISDVLGRGKSSRLKENWLKNNPLFSQINAYVTGDEDPGLMVIQGNLLPETTWEEAEKAIWSDLHLLCNELISEYNLEKIKNQYQTSQAFSNIDSSSIALNLAYFEWLGDVKLIHQEDEKYMNVSPYDIQRLAQEIFNASSLSSIYYHSKS